MEEGQVCPILAAVLKDGQDYEGIFLYEAFEGLSAEKG